MDILRRFVQIYEKTEIPGIFAVWGGLAAISASIGRRAFLDMGTYTLYPNFYIVLVASSGKCRKSTAVGIVERTLGTLDHPPNIVAQKLTPEALIDALRVGNSDPETTKLFREVCEGYILVDELANFLNRKTYESGLPGLLISLYDCKDEFTYRTKGRGIEKLTFSYLGMLSASTIDWIRDALPEDSIGSGLTSRIIFVYAQDPSSPVAITSWSDEKEKAWQDVILLLNKVNKLQGAIRFSQDAWSSYEKEYNFFYEKSNFYHMKTLAGYAARRGSHHLKLSVLFALSRTQTLIVEEVDVIAAKDLLSLVEQNMPKVLELISSSDVGMLNEEIFTLIKQNKELELSRIIARMSHKLDYRGVWDVLDTLVRSEVVQSIARGGRIFYSVRK